MPLVVLRLKSFYAFILLAALTMFSLTATAQDASSIPDGSTGLQPRPLITRVVDERQLTVLKGNTHRLARPENDLGTASGDLPMQRMLLVLKRSPNQEHALRKLLDDQQDKRSPNYHKWLTPEQYGKTFGPTDADMQTITSWLQSHGFQVGTTKGRTVLEFSGTANQVQEAFHTSIHNYLVHGESHWANSSDPSIPVALTPAVAGVFTLHNFLKKPQSHYDPQPAMAKIVPGKKPQVTFSENGQEIHALGPQDYATIYNIGSTYNGSGKTIGVVGRSNLYNFGEDVSDFRNYAFGVCCGGFDIVLNGPDPGDLGGNEEAEATLDSTWSGAIASWATVHLVVSASTNTTDGVDLSEVYIIENNLADVMTESFGSCELFASDSELLGTTALAEQAAAQGITYMVSAGDNGAEGCDSPSNPPATNPISVNELASTAFTVAVGGTMFNENGQDSLYWGTEQPISESAISYIPEDVWNESSASSGLWSGSGGASAGNLQNGGSIGGVPKPAWQAGLASIPDDGVRDLPDISLTAASHDPYLVCLEGSCLPDNNGELFIYFFSGTSASAPSFAGIMAQVDQSQNSRQGQANYVLYRLAAAQSAYPSQCNGSGATTSLSGACIFHDVTVGNNVVPGEVGSFYQAAAGYDLATGLGSVNVTNLINNWNTVTFNPTTTTLGLNPKINITHGSSVTVHVSVAPNSGTGTPTGDVSLLANNGVGGGQTSVDGYTLGNGSVSNSTRSLPGGDYNVWAHYAGDATYAASDSTLIEVTVGREASATTETVFAFDQNGNSISLNSIPYGNFIYLRADVHGSSGYGIPTGIVTFADTFGTIPGGGVFTLNSQGNTADPQGIPFDAGTHSVTSVYNGDASFNSSPVSAAVGFTVAPGFFTSIASNGSRVMISAPGGSGTTTATVANSTGFSGTINLTCSGLPAGAKCTFSPSSITASGTTASAPVTISITTTAATAMQPQKPLFLAHYFAVIGLLFSVVLLGGGKQRRMRGLPLLLLLGMIVIVPACGGGGGGTPPPPPPNPGTPTGNYAVIVNATSGSITSQTGFTLVVQ